MNDKYSDIARMPHKEPRNRVRMPSANRAAQFAPFAALTGLDGEMAEEARLTDRKKELCEFECEELDRRLRILLAAVSSGVRPTVCVKYFIRDGKKSGGKYANAIGRLRRIDIPNRRFIFCDMNFICIDDVAEISVLNENGERDDSFF